eukprot:TRINITY_DN63524_c0_g1_i1.p1 TRINITY_DN63524_c0_g1~~TRINITY_DN63524_c0_g1_i1.p1  ORF type:complete len:376 (+),score=32.02 TRINITY_DN63524_c0_g1_i1:61-1128(+)
MAAVESMSPFRMCLSSKRQSGASEEIVVSDRGRVSQKSKDSVKPAPGAPPRNIPMSLDAYKSLAMKEVKDVMLKPRQHWVGDGFHVFPVFSSKAFTRALSPFLMFDYASPKHFDATRGKLGVGRHPHRGFETVTIAWQGEVEHGDHLGNRDVIHAGDVQWMTAARGIIHEEYHSREFAKTGGQFEMCQLWVNLPAKHKMDPARYQPIQSKSIPSVDLPSNAGYVRVIAGSHRDAKGPAKTFSPIDLWEVFLVQAGKVAELVFPDGHNTIVFVRKGSAAIGTKERKLKPQDVALLGESGRSVPIRALEDSTMLLVLSGEPFNEPIAHSGPMCMNTREELNQAFEDYSSRKNGFGRC